MIDGPCPFSPMPCAYKAQTGREILRPVIQGLFLTLGGLAPHPRPTPGHNRLIHRLARTSC